MPEIYIKVHYCIVCKKTEVCTEATCDFRELMHSHGACYGQLTKTEQEKLDQVLEKGLSADVKATERKAKRKCYMEEYRKQWKELNPKYHNTYRENNPDTMKSIRKKYTSSDKGKAVRKKYADKTKAKRSEYQKNYMKQYRAKKKEEKERKDRYKISPPFGIRQRHNPLASPNFGKSFNTAQLNPLKKPRTKQPLTQSQAEAKAIALARKVRESQALKDQLVQNSTLSSNLNPPVNDPLSKEQKVQLLTTRISELETLLELGTEGTQGVVSIQKQLMKLKTALRRMRK